MALPTYFLWKRYTGDLSLCPVKAIEIYISVSELLGISLLQGYLFRPTTPSDESKGPLWTSPAAQSRLSTYVHQKKFDGHNKSTLRKRNVPSKTCNCRQPDNCPMAWHCLKSSVVYLATVATNDNRPVRTYVGLTENSFKTRFANHKSSFRDPNKRLSTELSKHIWHLKDSKLEFKITWKILKQAVPFNPASNRCNLCLWEKYFIICRPDLATLNKRNELVTSCRHESKFLLSNRFKSTFVTQ